MNTAAAWANYTNGTQTRAQRIEAAFTAQARGTQWACQLDPRDSHALLDAVALVQQARTLWQYAMAA